MNSIATLWRGSPWPRRLRLLDNDFFGQPRDQWQARIREIRDGGFRVNITQDINIRLIDDECAQALASIQYRDSKFKRRKLYTAWDNLKDERANLGLYRIVPWTQYRLPPGLRKAYPNV